MNSHICTNPQQLALHDSYFERIEFINGNLIIHNIQYGHVFTMKDIGISIGNGTLKFIKVYSFVLNSFDGLRFDEVFKDSDIEIYDFNVERIDEGKNKYTIHFGREFYNDLIVEAERIEFSYTPGKESENFVSKDYQK